MNNSFGIVMPNVKRKNFRNRTEYLIQSMFDGTIKAGIRKKYFRHRVPKIIIYSIGNDQNHTMITMQQQIHANVLWNQLISDPNKYVLYYPPLNPSVLFSSSPNVVYQSTLFKHVICIRTAKQLKTLNPSNQIELIKAIKPLFYYCDASFMAKLISMYFMYLRNKPDLIVSRNRLDMDHRRLNAIQQTFQLIQVGLQMHPLIDVKNTSILTDTTYVQYEYEFDKRLQEFETKIERNLKVNLVSCLDVRPARKKQKTMEFWHLFGAVVEDAIAVRLQPLDEENCLQE
eukprot:206223_1